MAGRGYTDAWDPGVRRLYASMMLGGRTTLLITTSQYIVQTLESMDFQQGHVMVDQ